MRLIWRKASISDPKTVKFWCRELKCLKTKASTRLSIVFPKHHSVPSPSCRPIIILTLIIHVANNRLNRTESARKEPLRAVRGKRPRLRSYSQRERNRAHRNQSDSLRTGRMVMTAVKKVARTLELLFKLARQHSRLNEGQVAADGDSALMPKHDEHFALRVVAMD